MRILVHDYSGHPFQVELSRELARRGHEVTHSYCPGWVSGKGHLVAEPGETLTFDPVGPTEPIAKDRFVRRVRDVSGEWQRRGRFTRHDREAVIDAAVRAEESLRP